MNKIEEFLQQTTVVDTETTGVDMQKSEVIELAGGRYTDGTWVIKESLFGSNEPIPPEASAVNYISNKMVAGFPKIGEALDVASTVMALDNTEYMVAHNSNFDRRMLLAAHTRVGSDAFNKFEKQEVWICTWKLAQQILGHRYDQIKYSLSYLRYFLDLEIDDSLAPHRAPSDVTTCGVLLQKLIDIAVEFELLDSSADIGPQLQKLCWKPLDINIWPLGKHKGKKINDVPTDYFLWCIDNIDLLNQRINIIMRV